MGIDGVRTTGQLPIIKAKSATVSTADAAPTPADTPRLTNDSTSILASKLETWSKSYQSSTPENIKQLQDAFQNACGRQPTDYEIERALIRADIRGMDSVIDSIKTSTEAAVYKYGSKIDSMLETAARNLRLTGKLDEEGYNAFVNNPSRKAFFADMLMQGISQDAVSKRLQGRLEQQSFAKATEIVKLKEKEPEIVKLKEKEPEIVKRKETAPSEAWKHGEGAVKGTSFSSVGDPHETTGDGLKFDNMARGEFIKAMSASGDFVLQTRQKPASWNAAVTVNTAAAVKLGKDVVEYNGENNELTINGKKQQIKSGQTITLPDGGSVKLSGSDVELTSPKGDKVTIQDVGAYINVTGSISNKRKDGEVRGSLGVFDSDTLSNNDLLGRTGNAQLASVAAFIEEWRVQGSERLFNSDEASGEDQTGVVTDAQIAEKNFMLRDLDDDGKISGKEMSESLKKYDQNEDGTVTKEEYLAQEAKAKGTTKSLDFSWLFDRMRKDEEERKRQEEEQNKKK